MFDLSLLSNTIYASPENSWILHGVSIPEDVRSKMFAIGKQVLAGQTLNAEQCEFVDSKAYQDAQHQCDIISGKYYELLCNRAQQLMTKKGYIKHGDFEVCEDRYYIVKPAVYCQHDRLFTSRDKSGTTYFVRIEEVEAFAKEVAQ